MHRIIVVALCALIFSSAFGQSAVTGETLDETRNNLPDEIGPIRVREYQNTDWKKIRNTLLYWIAPDVLATIWPYRAYDVDDVRSLSCDSSLRDRNLPLGRSLMFVNQTYPVGDPTAFGGLEFDYNQPNAGPHLDDLCALLEPTSDLSAASFHSAFLRYDALNPLPNGSWEIVTDRAGLPDDALPLFRGGVDNIPSDAIPDNVWIAAETERTLRWSRVEAEGQTSQNQDIEHQQRIWKYSPFDPGDSWPFFLTENSAAEDASNISQKWRTPGSVFHWESPPDFSSSREYDLLLWAASSAMRTLGTQWYLVTDRIFDRILSNSSEIRFEKSIARGPSVPYNFGNREHSTRTMEIQ